MNLTEQENIEKAGLVKVVFDYPIDIGMPNFYFPVSLNKEGEFGSIRISRFEGIQVFDKGKILRDNINKDGKKTIDTNSITVGDEKNQEIVGYAYEDIPAFHHIVGNKGRSLYSWFYSRVEIVFSISDVRSAWTGPKNSDFINRMAMLFFNKFLLSYRDATYDVANKYLSLETDIVPYRELYVSEFTDEEKLLPTIATLAHEFIEKKDFVPFFNIDENGDKNPLSIVQASISGPLKNNIKKKDINRHQAERILHTSIMPASIPVFNEVLLSSMERLYMDHDARMTIVDLDTAVEMTIAHYIFSFLIEEGKSLSEIVDLFDEDIEASRKLGNKGYLTTMRRLRRLEEFFNKKLREIKRPPIVIEDSKECEQWNTLVRKRRNAAVHAWEQFDENQAKESFDAAQKFIRYLQKIGDELVKK